jgi:hypothetical protein
MKYVVVCIVQKMILAPRHRGGWLFKHQQFQISDFKKNLDVAVYTMIVQFFNIKTLLCRLAKKTNWSNLEKKSALFMLPDLIFCYFYRGHNTKYFKLKFCTTVVHAVVYSEVFFEFFKSFNFFFKNGG